MTRRITVFLDDDVYEELVKESIRRYGTIYRISLVLNELLRERLRPRNQLLGLLYLRETCMDRAG